MNIKRYALPVSIAAAMHTALVLFFPTGPHNPVQIVKVLLAPDPAPAIEEPPPPPEEKTEDQRPTTLGTEEQPIEAPDSGKTDSERPIIDVRPPAIHPSPYVPLQPPGSPNGTDQIFADPHPVTVFSSDVLDRTPRATTQMQPDYPYAMKAAGISGDVLVEFVVDSGGRVMTARVVRSSESDFEAATIRAVLKWRFEPGKRNGRAVPFRMVVPVQFKLEGT